MRPRVLPAFLINLNEIPAKGLQQLVVRLNAEGAGTINKAAQAMRMSQANYLRTVLVRVSEAVIYEVYGHVDQPTDIPNAPDA